MEVDKFLLICYTCYIEIPYRRNGLKSILSVRTIVLKRKLSQCESYGNYYVTVYESAHIQL